MAYDFLVFISFKRRKTLQSSFPVFNLSVIVKPQQKIYASINDVCRSLRTIHRETKMAVV